MGSFKQLLDFCGWNDQDWTRFLLRWFWVGLLIHIVAAIFSGGYYHYDEHFQILEFMSYKLGMSPGSDLPWEFPTQQRPWLQPFLCYFLAKIWTFLGVKDVLVWATTFRLFFGIFAHISSFALGISCYRLFKHTVIRNFAVISLSLLWFLPFIHVRTSSESLSGSFFILGIALLSLNHIYSSEFHKNKSFDLKWSHVFAVGLLMGLGFISRYTTGIMIVGVGFWSLFIGKMRFPKIAIMALGTFVAILIGSCFDRFGYGSWVISWWNYLDINIFQDRASDFGRDPWWAFIYWGIKKYPPLSSVLTMGILWGWLCNYRQLVTWASASLFLIHSMIPAKDIRYLFELSAFLPIIFFMGLERLHFFIGQGEQPFFLVKKMKWVALFFVFLNMIGLIILTFRPGNQSYPFYSYVYKNFRERFHFYTWEEHPYTALGKNIHFYRPNELIISKLSSSQELEGVIKQNKDPVIVFTRAFYLADGDTFLSEKCHKSYRFLPDWMANFNYTGWIQRSRVWTLFRCQNN